MNMSTLLPAAYATTPNRDGVPVATVYRFRDGLVRVGIIGARGLHARAVATTAAHDWLMATDGPTARFPNVWEPFIDMTDGVYLVEVPRN